MNERNTSVRMSHSPCMNCNERILNCHSNCKRYEEFKEEVERVNKNREDYKLNRSAMFWSKYFK